MVGGRVLVATQATPGTLWSCAAGANGGAGPCLAGSALPPQVLNGRDDGLELGAAAGGGEILVPLVVAHGQAPEPARMHVADDPQVMVDKRSLSGGLRR